MVRGERMEATDERDGGNDSNRHGDRAHHAVPGKEASAAVESEVDGSVHGLAADRAPESSVSRSPLASGGCQLRATADVEDPPRRFAAVESGGGCFTNLS